MKKTLRVLLAVLAIVVSAVYAWGAGAPVVLTHSLTGYSKGEKAVTLEYAVQVQNQEDRALGPVTLTLVPRPPFINKKTKVTVETLPPRATANIGVKVVTPMLLDRDYFSKEPLFWAGKCTAADGSMLEFSVMSQPGGAK